jgi:secondary thiamine-phosphate synthase enzyme
MFETIGVKTSSRIEMIDITGRIADLISKQKIKNGLCCLFVPHTTAGVTINENADYSVQLDINSKLNELIIAGDSKYSHLEGNSDSHIKSTVVGQSLNIIIENGRLFLGTWQGIFFCEFDGPRNRNLHIKIIEG